MCYEPISLRLLGKHAELEAERLEEMESALREANDEYRAAVARARAFLPPSLPLSHTSLMTDLGNLTGQITTLLRMLLDDTDADTADDAGRRSRHGRRRAEDHEGGLTVAELLAQMRSRKDSGE